MLVCCIVAGYGHRTPLKLINLSSLSLCLVFVLLLFSNYRQSNERENPPQNHCRDLIDNQEIFLASLLASLTFFYFLPPSISIYVFVLVSYQKRNCHILLTNYSLNYFYFDIHDFCIRIYDNLHC